MKYSTTTRRSILKLLGWGSFFMTLGISLIGSVRFLYPRVLFEEPSVFPIGFPDEFQSGGVTVQNTVHQVFEKWKKEKSVWIVREKNRMYAIYSKCTHLGCTPNWFADEKVFKCPCHGSQFDGNGVNFAGPAPRPLDRCKIFINDEGKICVDKSRVYTFKDFNKQGAYLEV